MYTAIMQLSNRSGVEQIVSKRIWVFFGTIKICLTLLAFLFDITVTFIIGDQTLSFSQFLLFHIVSEFSLVIYTVVPPCIG